MNRALYEIEIEFITAIYNGKDLMNLVRPHQWRAHLFVSDLDTGELYHIHQPKISDEDKSEASALLDLLDLVKQNNAPLEEEI